MSNHVHLLVQPHHSSSLARALGNGHGKYAQWFNGRHGLSGHLWAGRFFSTALDKFHLWAAVRYIELNPVRAGLCARAEDWSWSSAASHVSGETDIHVSKGGPFVEREFSDWSAWLHEGLDDATISRIRQSTQTGRPCGDKAFIQSFEEKLDRLLMPQKPGPKPRDNDLLTEDMFS